MGTPTSKAANTIAVKCWYRAIIREPRNEDKSDMATATSVL